MLPRGRSLPHGEKRSHLPRMRPRSRPSTTRTVTVASASPSDRRGSGDASSFFARHPASTTATACGPGRAAHVSNDGAALDPMRATRVDGDRDGREATGQCQRGRSFWYNGSMTDPQRGVMRPPVSPESVLRFGRHRGRRIADLDDGYLYWLVRRAGLYDSTRQDIRDELRRRGGRRRSWRPVVRAVYGRQLLDVSGRGCYAVVQSLWRRSARADGRAL